MTKVFNRAIKLAGEDRLMGGTSVKVLQRDIDNNVLMATGTSVPTGEGYAKGAIFIKTDAASATSGFYENIGTTSSADFNQPGATTAGEISLADGDVLVGNASGVAAAVTLSGDATITNAGVVSLASDLTLDGTTIANQTVENTTAFRVKGLQHSSEGGAAVQNYAGIFTNDNWDTVGSLKTRATFSGNADMDLSFQTPETLLLLAEGSGDSSAAIAVLSETNVTFHLRADSETAAQNQLIIDRFDTGTNGDTNTSDVNIDVNTGNLRLMGDNTTGAPIVNSLTDAERDALTGVKGMLIYNETADEYQVYDGAWKAITVGATS